MKALRIAVVAVGTIEAVAGPRPLRAVSAVSPDPFGKAIAGDVLALEPAGPPAWMIVLGQLGL